MQDLTTFVRDVGFPVVCALLLLLGAGKKLDALNASVTNGFAQMTDALKGLGDQVEHLHQRDQELEGRIDRLERRKE